MYTSVLFAGLLATIARAGQPPNPANNRGRVPALGWNSWNAYHCDVNETKILAAAQKIVDLGLKNDGYVFVNIDDCWSIKSGRDPKTKRLQPDLSKFPSGINGTVQKIHSMGLLAGIYSSAGTQTCAGYPASIGYEKIDAQTWAEWGIDYLKYDNCNVPQNWTDSCNSCDLDAPNGPNGTCTGSSDGLPLCSSNYDYSTSLTTKRYNQMRDALNSVSHPILYSLCEWGREKPWTWGNSTAVSWRTTNDIDATWPRILSIMNQNSFIMNYVNFWSHGDPDILEVGNGNLTYEENRSHFALWAAMKAPLLISTDLTTLNSSLLSILRNKYLIGFNQDSNFGPPAKPFKWGTNPMWTFNASFPAEYWAGPSTNGTLLLMFNPANQTVTKSATWSEIPGLSATKTYKVIDAWKDVSLGNLKNGVTATVAAHDSAVYLIQNVAG